MKIKSILFVFLSYRTKNHFIELSTTSFLVAPTCQRRRPLVGARLWHPLTFPRYLSREYAISRVQPPSRASIAITITPNDLYPTNKHQMIPLRTSQLYHFNVPRQFFPPSLYFLFLHWFLLVSCLLSHRFLLRHSYMGHFTSHSQTLKLLLLAQFFFIIHFKTHSKFLPIGSCKKNFETVKITREISHKYSIVYVLMNVSVPTIFL